MLPQGKLFGTNLVGILRLLQNGKKMQSDINKCDDNINAHYKNGMTNGFNKEILATPKLWNACWLA